METFADYIGGPLNGQTYAIEESTVRRIHNVGSNKWVVYVRQKDGTMRYVRKSGVFAVAFDWGLDRFASIGEKPQ